MSIASAPKGANYCFYYYNLILIATGFLILLLLVATLFAFIGARFACLFFLIVSFVELYGNFDAKNYLVRRKYILMFAHVHKTTGSNCADIMRSVSHTILHYLLLPNPCIVEVPHISILIYRHNCFGEHVFKVADKNQKDYCHC